MSLSFDLALTVESSAKCNCWFHFTEATNTDIDGDQTLPQTPGPANTVRGTTFISDTNGVDRGNGESRAGEGRSLGAGNGGSGIQLFEEVEIYYFLRMRVLVPKRTELASSQTHTASSAAPTLDISNASIVVDDEDDLMENSVRLLYE